MNTCNWSQIDVHNCLSLPLIFLLIIMFVEESSVLVTPTSSTMSKLVHRAKEMFVNEVSLATRTRTHKLKLWYKKRLQNSTIAYGRQLSWFENCRTSTFISFKLCCGQLHTVLLLDFSNLGPPHISESIRARKLKFYTHWDRSNSLFGHEKFSALGRLRAVASPIVNLELNLRGMTPLL